MKKMLVGSALVFVAAIMSCKEIRKKLMPAINVNVPGIKLTIPPITFISDKEIPVGSLKIPLNMDSTIKANTGGTFGAGAVASVKVKKVVIKLLNADEKNNLSNFESARMMIYNDTSSLEIATIQFPQNSSDSITYSPANSPDISGYLNASSLAYNLFWKNRSKTNKFLQLDVKLVFGVQ